MADPQEQREWMVERQIRRRGIDSPSVLAAFRAVPREMFVPEAMREFAYEDGPLPIGEGQTISAPTSSTRSYGCSSAASSIRATM